VVVVIAYDIGDGRRRQEVSVVLEACGARVQYSVFECVVASVEVLVEVIGRIESIVDEDDDQVRFYVLGAGVEPRIVGNRRLQERQPFWIL
jgi:CRISPR-associated protein Cas2